MSCGQYNLRVYRERMILWHRAAANVHSPCQQWDRYASPCRCHSLLNFWQQTELLNPYRRSGKKSLRDRPQAGHRRREKNRKNLCTVPSPVCTWVVEQCTVENAVPNNISLPDAMYCSRTLFQHCAFSSYSPDAIVSSSIFRG